MNISILLIAVFTAMSASIVGVFLVLRKMSMMTDAISHTVLLGIVLAYMLVHDLNSPLLILGATIMGVITVYLIELIVKSKRTSEDAATGVVFPLLFSIAVIIISLRFRDVHLDVDAVLLGNLEFTVFDQLVIFGTEVGPKALYIMLGVLILNLLFFIIFYKELKIVSFDAALAMVLGISPVIIHYALMFLVSLTAVSAFNAVGAILVIALMVGPAMTALLYTKNLFSTVLNAIIIGILNSVVGYLFALYFDVVISGSIATVTLVVFLLVFLFNPKNGVLFTIYRRSRQKNEFKLLVLLMHIYNHQDGGEILLVDGVYKAIDWNYNYYRKYINLAIEKEYIEIDSNLLKITNKGTTLIESMLSRSV